MDTGAAEDYFRKLLIERPYIRAALENPGGSIILLTHNNVEQQHVSTICGNEAHLDLMEAEDVLRAMPKEQAKVLLRWSSGLTTEQAASLQGITKAALRKRRSRAVREAVKAMSDDAS